jgi:hypothetical protein
MDEGGRRKVEKGEKKRERKGNNQVLKYLTPRNKVGAYSTHYK